MKRVKNFRGVPKKAAKGSALVRARTNWRGTKAAAAHVEPANGSETAKAPTPVVPQAPDPAKSSAREKFVCEATGVESPLLAMCIVADAVNVQAFGTFATTADEVEALLLLSGR